MKPACTPPSALANALDSVFFKALADPARQRIVCILMQEGRLDVNGIAQFLTQERSVVSRHLKILHEAQIVCGEKIGRHVMYCLNGNSLLRYLECLTNEVRKLVKAHAQAE